MLYRFAHSLEPIPIVDFVLEKAAIHAHFPRVACEVFLRFIKDDEKWRLRSKRT